MRAHISKVKRDNKDRVTLVIIASRFKHGIKTISPVPAYKKVFDEVCNTVGKNFDICDRAVVIGYRPRYAFNKLSRKSLIIENPLYEHTNSAFDLRLAIQATRPESVLVMESDFIPQSLPPIDESFVNIWDSNRKDRYDIGVIEDNGLATYMSFASGKKWGGIAMFRNNEIRIFEKIMFTEGFDKKYLYEAINMVIDMGGRFAVVRSEVKKIRKPGDIRE